MITEEKKAEKVALAKAHAKADRLVSGFFTHESDNRGCSVGCDAYDIRALKGDDWDLDKGPDDNYHAYVADYFGTPEWLEGLRDTIFEGLPQNDLSAWHIDIAEALPVGVDFEPIRHRIQRDILLEVAVTAIGEGGEAWRVACKAAVQAVAALRDTAVTEEVPSEARAAAEAAARAAVEAAARAAARAGAVAAGDARAAAWSARAARAAARAAAVAAGDVGAAAWSARAAGAGAYQRIAEITLKHLREAGAVVEKNTEARDE